MYLLALAIMSGMKSTPWYSFASRATCRQVRPMPHARSITILPLASRGSKWVVANPSSSRMPVPSQIAMAALSSLPDAASCQYFFVCVGSPPPPPPLTRRYALPTIPTRPAAAWRYKVLGEPSGDPPPRVVGFVPLTPARRRRCVGTAGRPALGCRAAPPRTAMGRPEIALSQADRSDSHVQRAAPARHCRGSPPADGMLHGHAAGLRQGRRRSAGQSQGAGSWRKKRGAGGRASGSCSRAGRRPCAGLSRAGAAAGLRRRRCRPA